MPKAGDHQAQSRDSGIFQPGVDDPVSAFALAHRGMGANSGLVVGIVGAGPTSLSDGTRVTADAGGAEARAVRMDAPRTTPRKS